MGPAPEKGGWERKEFEGLAMLVGGPLLILIVGGPMLVSAASDPRAQLVVAAFISMVVSLGLYLLVFRRGMVSRSFAFGEADAERVVEAALAATGLTFTKARSAGGKLSFLRPGLRYRLGGGAGTVEVWGWSDSSSSLCIGKFHRPHDERLHGFIETLDRFAKPAGRVGEAGKVAPPTKIPTGYATKWRRDASTMTLALLVVVAIVPSFGFILLPGLGPLVPARLVLMLGWITLTLVPGLLFIRLRGTQVWQYFPVPADEMVQIVTRALRDSCWEFSLEDTLRTKQGRLEHILLRLRSAGADLVIDRYDDNGCNLYLRKVNRKNEPVLAPMVSRLEEMLRPETTA